MALPRSSPQSPASRAEEWAGQRFGLLLGAICALSLGWCLWITGSQHASLHTYLADVGSFHYVVGGPLHGNWLRTPIAWDVEGASYWGIHFQPLLLAITPFYLLHSGAMTLLAFLAAGVALAAWPAGILARRVTGSALLGLAFAVAWSLNHFVGSVHLANHPEALAFPFWFLALWGVEARRRGVAAAGLVLALAVKEDLALQALLLGVALALDKPTRQWGLAIAGAGLAWGLASVGIMAASGAGAMAEAGATATSRFTSFGDSPPSILAGMLASPGVVLQRLLSPALLAVYGSVLFLSLLDWRRAWLPAATLAPVLACDDALLRSLAYYYSYPALPFLFWTAMHGARALREKWPGHPWIAPVLAGLLAASAVAQALLPTRTDGFRRVPFAAEPRAEALRDVIDFIPPDAAVAAQFDLYPQVPLRPVLVPFRLQFLDRVDMILLNQRRFPADLSDKGDEFARCMDEVQSGRWAIVVEQEGFVLLERVSAAGESR